jgi:hypothetical protein
MPTKKDHTWSTYENTLVIDPKKDKNFQREGTYYIMVTPKASFYEALFSGSVKYQYLLSYQTEDLYLYLSNLYPLELV